KTGCTYRVLSKKGFPFLFRRYRKRKFLFASFLLSVCELYVLSLFLWQIETVGCYSHSSEEIMDYLDTLGIRSGKRLSEISCHDLEEMIREDFDDIAWVSCDLQGTLLTVTIKETLDTEAIAADTEDVPCNLIASKEGVIDSIVVRSGSALVKQGDAVKAGDVLISGAIELYDDSGELLENILVKAEGDITATTKISYEDSFSLLYYVKEYTGKTSSTYQLLYEDYLLEFPDFSTWPLLSSLLPALFGNGEDYAYYDEETVQTMLHIGSQLYLPLTFYATARRECDITEKIYTEAEAKEEAENRLSIFLKEYEEKGVEILKKNVKIVCDENTCTVKGTITLREHFGKIQEIDEEEFRAQEEASGAVRETGE
ncbi:MAG: sporulation protein YqfD, partial [Clostridiales bacterium]|nr:sporulation protein YqfD [Clostridiales bacterium]